MILIIVDYKMPLDTIYQWKSKIVKVPGEFGFNEVDKLLHEWFDINDIFANHLDDPILVSAAIVATCGLHDERKIDESTARENGMLQIQCCLGRS